MSEERGNAPDRAPLPWWPFGVAGVGLAATGLFFFFSAAFALAPSPGAPLLAARWSLGHYGGDPGRLLGSFASAALGVFMLFAALRTLLRIVRHRRLEGSTRALEQRTFKCDMLGFLRAVRGSIDGRACVVTPDVVEVEVGATKVTLPLGKDDDVVAVVRTALASARKPAVLAPTSATPTCPYCKDAPTRREAEGAIRCPSCSTLHHTPCWAENAGCAIHGCDRGRAKR